MGESGRKSVKKNVIFVRGCNKVEEESLLL